MPPRAHRSLAVLTAVMLLAALPMPVAAAPPTPPSGPSTIDWSGYTWTVKHHSRKIGPGPNFFSASNVSLDEAGDLHLKIQRSGRQWTTAEVIANTTLGYGTYTWTIKSAPDFDANVVLGMFTWNDDPAYAHREIDIEYARWGNAADPTNAQYAVQPWDSPDHDYKWTQARELTNTIHSFTWTPGRVDFLSTTSIGAQIAWYSYSGADVPVPGGENPRINLWLFRGSAPTNGQPAEVIFDSFRFTPPVG